MPFGVWHEGEESNGYQESNTEHTFQNQLLCFSKLNSVFVGLVYEEVRGILRVFLENMIHDCCVYCESARRKTITLQDVIHACDRQGRKLYI